MKRLFLFASVILLLSWSAIAEEVPDIWQTVAEKTDFRATSTFAETMDYLHRVESRAPDVIRVTSFGRTAEGREMPLVIVSSDGAFTPAAAKATGKPILLLQSGIHAGEIDGKDASLMLLREIALGHRPDLAEAAVTLFVPIYNLDGHERVSPTNRPNQNGPVEGMGFRATTSGLNLNRDFLRLEKPRGSRPRQFGSRLATPAPRRQPRHQRFRPPVGADVDGCRGSTPRSRRGCLDL